jgi:hypothetical protein
LLKCSQVSALTKPRKADLKFITRWLGGENDGEGKHFLGIAGKQEEKPVEVMTWSEDFEEDYVALTSEDERDLWSSNIVAGILSIWHKTLGRGRVIILATSSQISLTDMNFRQQITHSA